MLINDKDKTLLALLSENGRASIAELARKLGLSRSTVKDRIERLERQGIIIGYTVRFSQEYTQGHIQAHVLINSNPKQSAHIVRRLRQNPAIKSLHAVNGAHDMIAIVSAESTKSLDDTLDEIGDVEGIERTESSIILSTKFEK